MATDLSAVYALLGTAIGIGVAAILITIVFSLYVWRKYVESNKWTDGSGASLSKSEQPLLPIVVVPTPSAEPASTSQPNDWVSAVAAPESTPITPGKEAASAARIAASIFDNF